MRNWNLYPQAYSSPSEFIASRLPMRNWNTSFIQKLSRGDSLPDYLWGIETNAFHRVAHYFSSFQTTYEELKLAKEWEPPPATALPDYLWGIETRLFACLARSFHLASRLPMRNWNLLKNENPHQLRRFQTTYEELKLWEGVKWGGEKTASRLPMRNWNPFQLQP